MRSLKAPLIGVGLCLLSSMASAQTTQAPVPSTQLPPAAGANCFAEAPAFCIEVLEDALAKHGKPEIFNTDQGSQFTGAAFTGVLAKKRSQSAWTAKARGVTMCSSSGSGAA